MGQCLHRYQHEHAACPHPTAPGSDRCIWHNPRVAKNDRYVAGLLAHVDHLGHGDLAEFHLAGLLWPEAQLTGRRLADVDLRDAVLDGADLSGADLARARLRRASFKNANLRGARLSGADLSATNLLGADLRDCDLRQAVLAGTVLMGCDLRGADLTGASIAGFQWNNFTRFAGIKGLDTAGIIGDEDDTRPFVDGGAALSPKDGRLPAPAPEPLADPDPQAMRTRSYAAAGERRQRDPTALVPLTPGSGARRMQRWRAACLVSLSGLLLAAGALAWSLPRARQAHAGGQHLLQLTRERDALKQQGEAYVAQLRAAEARAAEAGDRLDRLAQAQELAKAESEGLRAAVRDQAGEAARLRDRDDRAALLALRLAESEQASRRLAAESVRQERLNRILGDGLAQLRAEKEAMLKEREAKAVAATALASAQAEATRLRDEAAQAQRANDDLRAANQRLTGELLAAQRDIERYLARVSGSSLHDYLVGDESGAPLIKVAAGEPIALGGDYLVTLRLDPVAGERTVQARLVVQRPGGGADPDLSLVLYDEAKRPLRRVAYSFPHRDGGGPFTATTTTFSCDRFPAFVRVLVQPAGDGAPATARK